MKVVIYGAGADGIFNTGDCMTSWRGGPSWSKRSRFPYLPYDLAVLLLLLVLAFTSWRLLRYYSRLRHGQS